MHKVGIVVHAVASKWAWSQNAQLQRQARPQPCCPPPQVGCGDAALNSILCSNRAHVNLLLGNFRNAYQDGLAALRHNDQNIKVP